MQATIQENKEHFKGSTEKKVYELLEKLNIKYDKIDHEPVFTAFEAAEVVTKNINGIGCKNLFLQDTAKNYYLYFVTETKRADLKALRAIIGSKRLSFASEEKLYELLKLTKGSVTPLGVVNDSGKVIVLLDKDLTGHRVLMHPEINTTTLSIEYSDLIRVLEYCGNKYIEVDL